MASLTPEAVLAVLRHIAAPDGRGNVVSAGLVSDIAIDGGTVMFALTAAPQHMRAMEMLRGAVEKAVVDFPTPPLPDATATRCLIPGIPEPRWPAGGWPSGFGAGREGSCLGPPLHRSFGRPAARLARC